MTTSTYITAYGFNQDTGACNTTQYGEYSSAVDDLSCLSVHDVQRITRKTRHVPNVGKVCTVTLHTATGTLDIDAYITDTDTEA